MRLTNVRSSVAALAALVVIGAAPPAAAQWKWRDRSGQTQYSDRPPPTGTPDADIMQRPQAMRRADAPTAASAASAPSLSLRPTSIKPGEPELEARRRKAEQDEAARKKADDERQAAARAENCNRARSQLRALDDGMRIARINDNGEREILDDEARAAEAQRVQATVASDCR
jgi:hypothetical protein